MPTLHDLVSYCDTRTNRAAFKDYPGALNGLQFSNNGKVTKIGAAVDAGVIPFQKAITEKVDFLIVHHGMFWDMPRPITGPVYERFTTLMSGNCAVYSSHLPLDAHTEIGNNALLAKQLSLKPSRGFIPNEGGDIGLITENTLSREELKLRLQKHYTHVTAIEYGSSTPKEIAICSGSGSSALPIAIASGADTLITGELREEHFNLAQEAKLNLYLCGHYATEVHAVKALAEELAKKFSIPWTFISTENPL
jgi:dinuclear metal center YbgI/SA1388 family protein